MARPLDDGWRVNQSQQFDELMICRLDEGRKVVEPCSIIIFGASGDLTARKLIPALYHLCKEKQMPAGLPHHRLGAAREDGCVLARRAAVGAGPVLAHQTGGRRRSGRSSRSTSSYCQGDLDAAAAYEALEKTARRVRQRAAAPEPALLSGHLAQPVWPGGRAGASRRAAAEGRRATAGSGWWSKSPSATIWNRRAS